MEKMIFRGKAEQVYITGLKGRKVEYSFVESIKEAINKGLKENENADILDGVKAVDALIKEKGLVKNKLSSRQLVQIINEAGIEGDSKAFLTSPQYRNDVSFFLSEYKISIEFQVEKEGKTYKPTMIFTVEKNGLPFILKVSTLNSTNNFFTVDFKAFMFENFICQDTLLNTGKTKYISITKKEYEVLSSALEQLYNLKEFYRNDFNALLNSIEATNTLKEKEIKVLRQKAVLKFR